MSADITISKARQLSIPTCEVCETPICNNCQQCGAPQCCPKCCDETTKELNSRKSRHKVEQVTWNDDGTMTLVIRGHVEPVRNGDYVVYVKRK